MMSSLSALKEWELSYPPPLEAAQSSAHPWEQVIPPIPPFNSSISVYASMCHYVCMYASVHAVKHVSMPIKAHLLGTACGHSGFGGGVRGGDGTAIVSSFPEQQEGN